MASLVLLCFCALVLWCVVAVAVPWMAVHAALYGLHTLRDRLYAVTRQFPAARDTLIYSDLEFILCTLIHVSRRANGLTFSQFSQLRKRTKSESWRTPVYERELGTVFAGSLGQQALSEMFDVHDRVDQFVTLRRLADVPVVLIVVIPFSWLLVLHHWMRSVFAAKPSAADVIPAQVEAIARIAKPPTRENTGSSIAVAS